MMKWLRVCAHCSGGPPPVDFLCDSCWKALAHHILRTRPRFLPSSPFPVGYLWQWHNEKLFSNVLYALKYASFPEVYLRLAEWMLQSEFMSLSSPKPQWIAFPTKDLSRQDHAFQLATALSTFLQAQPLPVTVISPKDYKKLGREDRFRERKVQSLKRVTGNVLFVDDVYTTGATARQVWQALGAPQGFRVAVLAYKRPPG